MWWPRLTRWRRRGGQAPQGTLPPGGSLAEVLAGLRADQRPGVVAAVGRARVLVREARLALESDRTVSPVQVKLTGVELDLLAGELEILSVLVARWRDQSPQADCRNEGAPRAATTTAPAAGILPPAPGTRAPGS